LRNPVGDRVSSRTNNFIFIVLVIISCLCFSGLAQADFRRDYVQAKKSLSKNDWEKAAERLRSAIADNDQENESARVTSTGFAPYLPYLYLGQALQGMGDCAGAVEAFQASEQQGVVQGLSNEYALLQAGMQACGPEIIDVSRVAALASGSIQSLTEARDAFAALADDPGLASEWAAEWNGELEAMNREVSGLQSRLQSAETAKDEGAIEAVTAESGQALTNLQAVHSRALDRIRVLDDARAQLAAQRQREQEAEAGRLAEERRKQNALDEANRLAAIEEREAAQRQAREQRELVQRRENIASAQRELRNELNSSNGYLRQTIGDDDVRRARSQLAQLTQTGQGMLSSEVVPDLENQTQALRDGNRRYQQVVQEWEASQREIARRTPPPELQQMADAYFSGNYDMAAQISNPDQFSEDRQKIQAYLFRSASLFNLYWLSGGQDEAMLDRAKADIAEIKRLNRDFAPYVAAFSPKYLEFYRSA
jgi:hypothetical protein